MNEQELFLSELFFTLAFLFKLVAFSWHPRREEIKPIDQQSQATSVVTHKV